MAYPDTTIDHVNIVNRFLAAQISATGKGMKLQTTGKKFQLILGEYILTEEDSIYAVENSLQKIKKIEPRPTGY
jgi:hypothetical protein